MAKCDHRGSVGVRKVKGNPDSMERGYKRMECGSCGKHTGWCGDSFNDQGDWLRDQWGRIR